MDTRIALIRASGEKLEAHGAFRRFRTPFRGGARPGDLFLLDRDSKPMRKLGRPSSVDAVLEALLLDSEGEDFSPALIAEAEALTENFPRRDLTKLPTFTIDGEHTCDFDDAISARREGKLIRVFVHVADVSAFVRPGSALDLEARKRATSIYLPGLIRPMLPAALSNGRCSLVPGEERAAVTCELLLDGAAIRERSFYRSKIRSIARLTYDEVDRIFLGQREPGPTYKAALAAARRAAKDLTRERDLRPERSSEAEFVRERGEVVAILPRGEGESHRLIERLMVLANREVASFLSERGAPTLYRSHESSSSERLEDLRLRLGALGLKLPAEHTLDSAGEAVARWRKGSEAAKRAAEMLLCQARAAAGYERECAPHSGLGLEHYCHFTSPIRRYADLVVHRALLSELGEEPLENSPRFARLPELAEHLNERGKLARKLERQANSICRASFIRRELRGGAPRRRTGVIVGMVETAGLFVDFGDAEGMLPARKLGGSCDPARTSWRSEKRVLRLGEQIEVEIRSVDPVRGRIELQPV